MSENLVDVILLPQSLFAVLLKQPHDEGLGLLGDRQPVLLLLGPSDGRVLDIVVHLMFILVVKGRDADYHLVE